MDVGKDYMLRMEADNLWRSRKGAADRRKNRTTDMRSRGENTPKSWTSIDL